MARVLRREFGVGARWLDERSRTTAENALESARILQASGVTRVLLVTHAAHMPRAVDVFQRAGLGVVPAPTAFMSAPPDFESDVPAVFAWVPSASALATTSAVAHEWMGRLWYRFRQSEP